MSSLGPPIIRGMFEQRLEVVAKLVVAAVRGRDDLDHAVIEGLGGHPTWIVLGNIVEVQLLE